MVGIGIRMLRIPFELLVWHLNASNPVRMVGIGIRMPRMLFKWLELAFERVRMVVIGIRMLLIPFEWLELAFECFESHSNGCNWNSNASIPV